MGGKGKDIHIWEDINGSKFLLSKAFPHSELELELEF